MPFRKNLAWTGKPPPGTQINMGDHLAQGLICAVPFNDGRVPASGGGPRDLMKRTIMTIGDNPITFSDRGPAVTLAGTTGAGHAIFFTTAPQIFNFTTQNFSFMVRAKLTNLATQPVLLWNGVFQSVGYYIQYTSTGSLFVSFNQGGTNQSIGTINGVVANNVWHTVIFTRNGATGKFYVNGTDRTTGSVTLLNPASSGNGLYLASYNQNATLTMAGTLDEFRCWNRCLLPTEVATLYAEPWRPFMPPRRHLGRAGTTPLLVKRPPLVLRPFFTM